MGLQGASGIITELLSSDSRTSVSDLSGISGISRPSASKILKGLTEELKLRFVLELDEGKLGYPIMHNVVVKFKKKADFRRIEGMVNRSPCINFACSCSGDFDMMFQVLSRNRAEYFSWEDSLIDQICEYRPIIMPSEIAKVRFGFFPMDNGLIASSTLEEEDRKILMKLNDDSRASLKKLEMATSINSETIKYRIDRMVKNGTIKRFTIASQKPQRQYALAYMSNYIFNRKTRYKASLRLYDYFDSDSLGLLNTFQNISLMSGSYKFFGIGIFKNEKDALENTVEKHIRSFGKDNVSVASAKILKVLKGLMPFRKLNIKRNYIQ
ncbi:MAG: Lrp/AsnC family transcriptional regulator [Candidatus Micrarchaeaceae archaeon]